MAEARSYYKMMQQKRIEAATLIQSTWRKYKKRKVAKDKLRRLKKEANQVKDPDYSNGVRKRAPKFQL